MRSVSSLKGTAVSTFHVTCPKPGVGAEGWGGSGGELLEGLLSLASKVESAPPAPAWGCQRIAPSRSVD